MVPEGQEASASLKQPLFPIQVMGDLTFFLCHKMGLLVVHGSRAARFLLVCLHAFCPGFGVRGG